MQNLNLKHIIVLFLILLLLLSTFCFATNTNDGIMLISDNQYQTDTSSQTRYSDLYTAENQYDIKNTIDGNVFASVGTLNIDPSTNGGIITGNLYATADTVKIKSNVKYSEEKDEFGNSKLEEAINTSKIHGNIFVLANKFVLEPACEIDGDLYICATEVELGQNAIINGNVFITSNTLNLNSRINNGSLYASVKNFNMKYYGFILKSLYLSAENVNLEGYIYRDAFIKADKITTGSSFINKGNLKIDNSSTLTFSGEVKGNADINCKNINFKSTDDDGKNINCKIYGNLNYSSKNEMQIENKIVLGSTNYSKYKEPNSFLFKLGEALLKILTSLVYVFIVYLIINKFAPKYIGKLNNMPLSKLLSYIGTGVLLLVIMPILSLLLFITRIGALLGLLLLIIYVLLLLITKPIFIIAASNILKNKTTNKKSNYISILAITFALSLITLIHYVGFIISFVVTIAGLGILVKSLKK